jgi:mannose-1-phosphate guanylyltransferase
LAREKVSGNTHGKLRAFLLAAGLGTRLAPLTDTLPKCLMPVRGRPVLEYWLRILIDLNADAVLVNLHHHADAVRAFLRQADYCDVAHPVYEAELLGTGGSLMQNREFLQDGTAMLIHADNFCQCDFANFIDFHQNKRPAGTLMTMMTHLTSNPQSSGIVELDEDGVVIGFHEKVANPPGRLANGAVFLIEPEVLARIGETYDGGMLDFSRDVIPHFLGRIATWHNDGYFRDIGTHENLKSIQEEDIDLLPENGSVWLEEFRLHPIHGLVSQI